MAANPRGLGKTTSRVSDPVVVDNTAPALGDTAHTNNGSCIDPMGGPRIGQLALKLSF